MLEEKGDSFIFSNLAKGSNQKEVEYIKHLKHNYQRVIDKLRSSKTPYVIISYFKASEQLYSFFDNIAQSNLGNYVNLRTNYNMDSSLLYASDKWHPSTKGHTVIARKILSAISSDVENYLNINN